MFKGLAGCRSLDCKRKSFEKMPKARKYKVRTSSNTNPLQRDEVHIKAQEQVLPVIQSLKSAAEKDRKWSSAIIGELVQDDTLRLTLLREGIVNALLDRLTDDNTEVKTDALGSIDALILKEGESLCKELYRKNILKLLEKTLLANWDDLVADKGPRAQSMPWRRLLFPLAESIYNVLNHICEVYEEANETAAGMGLLTQSFPILRNLSLPNSLRTAIAQFVLVLTTDQPERTHNTFSRLAPGRDLTFLLNFVYHEPQIRGDNNNETICAETITLNLILGEIVINLFEAYLPETNTVPSEVNQLIQHAKNTFNAEINSETGPNTNNTLSDDLVSSLRTLSSVATYLDAFLEAYPSATPQDNQDTVMDDAGSFDDAMDIEDTPSQMDAAILTELTAAIPLILQQQLSIPVIPIALDAINDIAWTMTRVPEWESWQEIANKVLEFAVPRIEGMVALGEDTLSTFLGCIWATAKASQRPFSLDADDIQLLESLYGRYPTAEFQAKIVGILGLAAQTESIETNKYITAFMMREITSQAPLVVIEIMDSVMEIFADGEKVYDIPVFVQGQVLAKLKESLPKLRKRIKGINSGKESELRERGDDVLENFVEFIKYKETEAKQR